MKILNFEIPTPFKIRSNIAELLPSQCSACGYNMPPEYNAHFLNGYMFCPYCYNHKINRTIYNWTRKEKIVQQKETIRFIFLMIGLVWVFVFGYFHLFSPDIFYGFHNIGFTIMMLPHLRLLPVIIKQGYGAAQSYYEGSDWKEVKWSDGTTSYQTNWSLTVHIAIFLIRFFIGFALISLYPFYHLLIIFKRLLKPQVGKLVKKNLETKFAKRYTSDRDDLLYSLAIEGDFKEKRGFIESYLQERKKKDNKLITDQVSDSRIVFKQNVTMIEAFATLRDYDKWLDDHQLSIKATYYII